LTSSRKTNKKIYGNTYPFSPSVAAALGSTRVIVYSPKWNIQLLCREGDGSPAIFFERRDFAESIN
jgi:hypothetical protein